MDLQLNSSRFLICGASSGFGKAIAEMLLSENAECILTARRGDLLDKEFGSRYSNRVKIIEGDLTDPPLIDKLAETAAEKTLHGVVFNAGGPPMGTPLETTDMELWDDAYQLVMRWKIRLALRLAPLMTDKNYGRMLFIESKSVKEPIPTLVLSNAFRAGVVGFAKSLAREIADTGVTVNVLAPGSHDTPAIGRVLKKISETEGISLEQARKKSESTVPVGRMGTGEEIAGLAAWLLSPLSGFVTGQTISHDGGSISGIFG
ncbi:MAG: SDR family oxidoreductase [Balneolaceae bacterium]